MSTLTSQSTSIASIHRIDRFLYELGDDALNLWSASVIPNNGSDPEIARRTAVLFAAAPELLRAARLLLDDGVVCEGGHVDTCARCAAQFAVAKAEGASAYPCDCGGASGCKGCDGRELK